MLNNDVVDISRKGVFSIEEANKILPVVLKITEEYSQQVSSLIQKIEGLNDAQSQQTLEIENEVNELISQWHSKINKLGGQPKGLWLVDFDSGDGYFCWKYPEPIIDHWHGYNDGFLGRVKLNEREVKNESSSCADQLNTW